MITRIIEFFTNLTMPKSIALMLNFIVAIITPLQMLIHGLLILIFIDLVTGIRKHHHTHNFPLNPLKKGFWNAIKSNALRGTWVKTYEYFMGIMVAVIFEKMIFGGNIDIDIQGKMFSLSKLAIIISSAIEMWSIFENMEAVSGRNILKRLVNFLPQKIQDLFKKEDNVE